MQVPYLHEQLAALRVLVLYVFAADRVTDIGMHRSSRMCTYSVLQYRQAGRAGTCRGFAQSHPRLTVISPKPVLWSRH